MSRGGRGKHTHAALHAAPAVCCAGGSVVPCYVRLCIVQTIDRVHFIINNITVMNIEQKVKELKAQVALDYWPW